MGDQFQSNDNCKLIVNRDDLLQSLQTIIGVIERRQANPILANVLLKANDSVLTMLGTDSSMEIETKTQLAKAVGGFSEITVSARKFLDICRVLPEDRPVEISIQKDRINISVEKNHFTLATLPAENFPVLKKQKNIVEFTIKQDILKRLMEKTYFAIPEVDLRNYLNGLLIEVKNNNVMAIASDSHRLAIYKTDFGEADSELFVRVIIPRRGVLELIRLLKNNENEINIGLNNNQVCVFNDDFVFTSSLISGSFPNYSKMVPRNWQKKITLNRDALRIALMRVAILSNEFSRSISLKLQKNSLQLSAMNPEHEEACGYLDVDYDSDELEIIFNANYLLDVLQCIDTEQVSLSFNDGDKGVIVEESGNDRCFYLVMPIKAQG